MAEAVGDPLSGVPLDSVMVSLKNLDSTSERVSLGWARS